VRDFVVGDEKEVEVEKVHFLKTSDGRLPNGTAFILLKGTGATAALAGTEAARLAMSLDGKEWGGRRVGVAVWERRERPRGGQRPDGNERKTRGDGERREEGQESPSAVGTNYPPITS
jgi:hypothetical protein